MKRWVSVLVLGWVTLGGGSPVSAAPALCEPMSQALKSSRVAYQAFSGRGAGRSSRILETFRGHPKLGGFAVLTGGKGGWCNLGFKGSDLTKRPDVLVDLASIVIAPCVTSSGRSMGTCALGFMAQFRSLVGRGRLFEGLKKHRQAGACGSGIIVGGHSLGGAMASLFAAEAFIHDPKVYARDRVKVFTFGEPRVFGTVQANRLHKEVMKWRFISRGDVVAALPPASLGFKHFGTTVHMDAKGFGLRNGKLSLRPEKQDFAPPHQGVFSIAYHSLMAYEVRLALCSTAD